MSILRIISFYLCVAVAALSSSPAKAQDVGGFINLMGRIIEQDMRNQEFGRQREAETRAAQQQQRAIAEQERARLNAIREREIALVRRLQASMSRLGFYDMAIDGDRGPGTQRAEVAFTKAFNLPPIQLNEDYIAQTELLADMGFRNVRELNQAMSTGFESRGDMLTAADGGFDNARDFESATGLGFTRYDDYRRFRASDFTSAEDYRLAAAGGFSLRGDYEKASALGFTEKSSYEEFRVSGLKDKVAFDEYRARLAKVRAAGDECRDAVGRAELGDAINKCLTALDHPESANVLPDLERLQKRVAEALEGISRNTPPVVVASQHHDTAAGADAGTFVQEQATLHLARNKLVCGVAVARKEWASASGDCALVASEGGDLVIQLAALAASELQEQQRLAAEEERMLKEAADVERHRLALNAGRERLTGLLNSIAAFTNSKRAFGNGIEVARAVVRLRQLEGADDVTQIEQAILNMEELLKDDSTYQRYAADQKTAREVAHVNARAIAAAELRRTEAFIADFVGGNVLHAAVNDLLKLQETIATAQKSGLDDALFHAQGVITAEIDRLKLRTTLGAFVYSDAPRETAVEQAINGLAITDANRALLEGNPRDVFILGNYSPTAPHLVVNLVGDTTFEDGTADLCWIGPAKRQIPLGEHVKPVLKARGAERISGAGICTSRNTMKQDVLVVQRGALLTSDLLEAKTIISEYEKGTLKTIEVVAWSQVGETADLDAQTTMTIKAEILSGVRQGFGFVGFENDDKTLCAVVDEDDAPVHKDVFSTLGATFERHVPPSLKLTVASLDRAFTSIQRNECRTVYAEAADLARLLIGLEKIDKSTVVLPVWVSVEEVAEARAFAASAQQEKDRHFAQRQQELEAAKRARLEKERDSEVVRKKREGEMRSRYSQEARAAHNDVSQLAKAFLNHDREARDRFGEMFSETSRWYAQMSSNGWSIDAFQDELVDYGTVVWKDRRLEFVIIEANVTTKNAVRGEYDTTCVLLGYMLDHEFETRRDALEKPCSDAADLAGWKSARLFESRWVAQ